MTKAIKVLSALVAVFMFLSACIRLFLAFLPSALAVSSPFTTSITMSSPVLISPFKIRAVWRWDIFLQFTVEGGSHQRYGYCNAGSIPYTFGNCALFIFKAICKTIGGGTAKLYFIQFYIPDYRSKL